MLVIPEAASYRPAADVIERASGIVIDCDYEVDYEHDDEHEHERDK